MIIKVIDMRSLPMETERFLLSVLTSSDVLIRLRVNCEL
jgi:hypothetical protein